MLCVIYELQEENDAPAAGEEDEPAAPCPLEGDCDDASLEGAALDLSAGHATSNGEDAAEEDSSEPEVRRSLHLLPPARLVVTFALVVNCSRSGRRVPSGVSSIQFSNKKW